MREQTQRTNYEWNLGFQGDLRSRLFYSIAGSVQKNHLYGYAGELRLGLAYVPVRPSTGFFHGTKLRANVATGVQEPSLASEYYSLYRQLAMAGDFADITLYGIGPERSRSADVGWDQNVLGESCDSRLIIFTTSSRTRSRALPAPTSHSTSASSSPIRIWRRVGSLR